MGAGNIPDVNYIARWDGTAWNDVSGGTDSYVTSLCVYGTKLAIGGYFTTAEAKAINHVGLWSNAGWEALGNGTSGVQGQVMTVGTYNGNLVAGGFFTTAGVVSASHIAQWNGTAWSPLGSGISNIVYSLNQYGTSLVAGGLFTIAGGVPQLILQSGMVLHGLQWAQA